MLKFIHCLSDIQIYNGAFSIFSVNHICVVGHPMGSEALTLLTFLLLLHPLDLVIYWGEGLNISNRIDICDEVLLCPPYTHWPLIHIPQLHPSARPWPPAPAGPSGPLQAGPP